DVSLFSKSRGPGGQVVREVPKVLDEWIVLEIAAKDQEADVRINGKPVMTLHDDKYKPMPGHVGVWVVEAADPEAKHILVRKIEVRELPPLAATDWVPLFNGKDLDGWTNAKKNFDAWKIQDGILIGDGDNAFLRSERGPYADFHLRMEAKYVGGTA